MTKNQKIIRNKVGLFQLGKTLGDVSKACKIVGFSRDSFYPLKVLYDKGGEVALLVISRRNPYLKNRVDEQVKHAVISKAIDQPADGQLLVLDELREQGVIVSSDGVRSIWLPMIWKHFKKASKLWGQGCSGELHLNRRSTSSVGKSKRRKRNEKLIQNIWVICWRKTPMMSVQSRELEGLISRS